MRFLILIHPRICPRQGIRQIIRRRIKMRTAHRYHRQNRILRPRRIHQVLENLRHGVVLRVPPRQYHAELVAADAEARPVIPIRAADATGNRPQAGVAHQVPMAVVDVLEAVNVEHQDGSRHAQARQIMLVAQAVDKLRQPVGLQHHVAGEFRHHPHRS